MKIYQALEEIRKKTTNELEKGKAFESISKIFFEKDPVQADQFDKVWNYEDWARENPKYSSTDIGIDLVAKISGSDRFAAIQSKCYEETYVISKSDIDSFISASSSDIFERLILIDTSSQNLGKNTLSP